MKRRAFIGLVTGAAAGASAQLVVPYGPNSRSVLGFRGGVGRKSNNLANSITDWTSRVVANGGAMPSAGTITAMETFRLGMISAGLDTKMHSLCVFVPDSLIAATTPLFVGIGSGLWTNHNFVSGDLTLEGLKGDGTTKYLDTGVRAASGFAINSGTGNVGLSMIVSQSSGNTVSVEMGTTESSSPSVPALMLWASSYSGVVSHSQSAFSCRHNNNSDSVHADDWIRTGFVSGNQVSGTSNLYVANAYDTFRTLTSGAITTDPTATSNTIFAFASNRGGTADGWSSRRISIMAIHDGLTSTQAQNFYNLLVTLRTALGGGLGNPVDDWSNRVVVSGGSTPSGGTITALKTFSDSLRTAGIYTKMAMVNPVVPDSLAAVLVPLICQAGSLVWTNQNFVSGDLTVNGLTGNGSTKNLITGIIPNNCYKWTDTDAGLSIMISNVPSASTSMYDFSCNMGGTGATTALLNLTSGGYMQMWGYATVNDYAGGALPSSAWPGFLTGSRVASNSVYLYRASTSNAFALAGSSSGAKTKNKSDNYGPPLTCFSQQIPGPIYSNYSDRTHSFYAAHQGLTSTEHQALYNAVAALRTALGGWNP